LNQGDIKTKVDLEWDDKHVVPSVVHPDLAFLFQQMNGVTLREMEAREGERILDIGCGRAIDAIELAKRGGSCFGLEPSRQMISHAKERIAESNTEVTLIRGIGEYLPFKNCSFDKVICKGALDHFPNPAKALEEIARVLKPEGKAIIVIANFESLSFRLGRRLFKIVERLYREKGSEYKVWQVPVDHASKFDYASLRRLVEPCLKVEQAIGISLFFGFPWWGQLLDKLPKGISLAILNSLDKLARHIPLLSDTVLIKCSPKPEIKSNY
jgi:ubiquinone/menaquinone biosynthesis C-methylase UbiE